MGGMGSGRSSRRWRGTVESVRRLDVLQLTRVPQFRAALRAGQAGLSGRLVYRRERVRGLRGRWTVAEEAIRFLLVHNKSWQGSVLGLALDLTYPDGTGYRVGLESQPCPYGHERWWFNCGECGRRCRLLHWGGRFYVCRLCAGLTYESRRRHRDWEYEGHEAGAERMAWLENRIRRARSPRAIERLQRRLQRVAALAEYHDARFVGLVMGLSRRAGLGP